VTPRIDPDRFDEEFNTLTSVFVTGFER
jgi:hypothetical protein